MGRVLLQSERNATLWIDLLRSYVAAGKFQLHDFVIMPDHVHLLITVSGDSTIERVMQFIKGRIFLSVEERIGVFGRGLATRLFRKCELRIGKVMRAIGTISLKTP
jgi:putative transposase